MSGRPAAAASDPVIVAAARTPVGRHGGAMAGVRPDDLAALILEAARSRSGIPAGEIGDVVLGCANQAGEDNRNVARMAALLAGFPVSVPGVTLNRLCASGLDAVRWAAMAVRSGEAQVLIAGGVESMSRAPYVLPKAERPYPVGNLALQDTTLGWRLVNPEMERRHGTLSMGETAELLADLGEISREQQDLFALSSHRKATRAQQAGRFAEEIVPVPLPSGPVELDQGPRGDTSLAALAKLRPVFRSGGTVTAGNSSPLNDGAAALVITARAYAEAHGLPVLATVLGGAVAGVEPSVMGLGPVPASAKLLARFGLELADLDLIELNEAFAAQVLAVLRAWKVDPEDPRLNPLGGAIALGHPLGASGARILTTAVYQLLARGSGLALVAMCVGVGQGAALLIERS